MRKFLDKLIDKGKKAPDRTQPLSKDPNQDPNLHQIYKGLDPIAE